MIIIDVGAYDGAPYLQEAIKNPALQVFAFEPNLEMATIIARSAPANYKLFPVAVLEKNGIQEYYSNISPSTNSILPFNLDNVPKWDLASQLKTVKKSYVPSIRLDTFVTDMNLISVDYLKIDAQGADLQVIKSAGNKLNVFKTIQIEVCDIEIYTKGNLIDETMVFMTNNKFVLKNTILYPQYKDLIFTQENK